MGVALEADLGGIKHLTALTLFVAWASRDTRTREIDMNHETASKNLPAYSRSSCHQLLFVFVEVLPHNRYDAGWTQGLGSGQSRGRCGDDAKCPASHWSVAFLR